MLVWTTYLHPWRSQGHVVDVPYFRAWNIKRPNSRQWSKEPFIFFKYYSTLKPLLLFSHNDVVTCVTSAFGVSMYVWTWKMLAVGGFKRYLKKIVFLKSPFSLNPNFPTQFNPCVSWQICYNFNITINLRLYSLEPKNYTKLWVHGNWGRTETGDTTVFIFMLLTWNARMNHLFTSMEKSRARCWLPLFACMECKTS